MSTIYRVGQCFGAHYVIAVLRGMHNQKIIERQHHKLSVYGIGKDKVKSIGSPSFVSLFIWVLCNRLLVN